MGCKVGEGGETTHGGAVTLIICLSGLALAWRRQHLSRNNTQGTLPVLLAPAADQCHKYEGDCETTGGRTPGDRIVCGGTTGGLATGRLKDRRQDDRDMPAVGRPSIK